MPKIETDLMGFPKTNIFSTHTYIDVFKELGFTYIRAVLAGIFIGLAGTMYLCCNNQVIGSFMFSLGLLAIIMFDLPLFTGKIGYLFHDKDVNFATLLITLVGNMNGTNVLSFLIVPTRIFTKIDQKVDLLVMDTIADTWSSTLCLAIICGMFMYIAVEGYKRVAGSLAAPVIVILSVMGFILIGSLHSIANMFYVYVCRSVELVQIASNDYRPLMWIGLMVLGNAIGSQIVSLLSYRKKKLFAFGESK